jgi:transposase
MRASRPRFQLKNLYQFKGFKFQQSEVENESIIIVLKRTSETGICPCCNRRCRYIHKRRTHKIRDLDIAGSKTYIEFVRYDIDCRCGYTGVENLDFCEEYSRYTTRFEEKVIILCTKMCIKDVSKEMRIGWEATKNIDKKNARKYILDFDYINPKKIGVDEIAYEKGHKYLTVVRDIDLGKVIWVGNARKKETLDEFFRKLGIVKCMDIRLAVCDMWDPYIASIRENTSASIVFDKFHIAKVINDVVDTVRKKEFAKADKIEKKQMKKKRFLILSRQKRLDDKKRETLFDLLDVNKNLYATYILKEQALDIFDEEDEFKATERLDKWIKNVIKSGIEEFIPVLNRIKSYLYGILNYFKYKLTNAQSEGFNNKINVIKRKAYGFRDLEYFKLKILQSCGLFNQTNP